MYRYRLFGAALRIAIVALACALILVPLPPESVERHYSNRVFPAMQQVATSISNVTNFALLDLLLLAGPIYVLVVTFKAPAASRSKGLAALFWLLKLAVAASVVVVVFYVMWGLNYQRLPLIRKIPYDARSVTPETARALADRAVDEINALYPAAHTYAATTAGVDPSLDGGFLQAQRALGVVRPAVPGLPKRSILDWYFKSAGVSGMTDPIFLETLVASDLIPFERSHVIAHEWGHLAGFVDEGEANFVGWLTCMKSSPAARYSGWMFLYSELVPGLREPDRREVTARLEFGPRADMLSAAERSRRDIKPVIANAGWIVYDRYLKANRVEAGRASYAQVVRIILGVRHDPNLFPQKP